jgi:hypothetical protein
MPNKALYAHSRGLRLLTEIPSPYGVLVKTPEGSFLIEYASIDHDGVNYQSLIAMSEGVDPHRQFHFSEDYPTKEALDTAARSGTLKPNPVDYDDPALLAVLIKQGVVAWSD